MTSPPGSTAPSSPSPSRSSSPPGRAAKAFVLVKCSEGHETCLCPFAGCGSTLRRNAKKEQLLEKELVLEEVTALSDKLRAQAAKERGG